MGGIPENGPRTVRIFLSGLTGEGVAMTEDSSQPLIKTNQKNTKRCYQVRQFQCPGEILNYGNFSGIKNS